jgi:hypothetical protein
MVTGTGRNTIGTAVLPDHGASARGRVGRRVSVTQAVVGLGIEAAAASSR